MNKKILNVKIAISCYILAFLIQVVYFFFIDKEALTNGYVKSFTPFFSAIPVAVAGILLGEYFKKKYKILSVLFYFHGIGCAISFSILFVATVLFDVPLIHAIS